MTLRVVYDTNVLVSATLTPAGIPASLVTLALAQRVQLCVSPPLLVEYSAVLQRPKFGFAPSSITAFLAEVRRVAVLVHPPLRLAVAAEEADNRFLECALEAGAAYLVTGNLRHFPPARFEDVQILAPAAFAHVLAGRLGS